MTNLKTGHAVSLLLLLTFQIKKAAAQDTHYGTNQYGARAALLGGAVVGGINDNTLIFYNPGGLAFTDTGALSINANVYQMEKIRIRNALGREQDFRSSALGSIPLLISGSIRTRNFRLRMGYGLIAPVGFNFKANARTDSRVNIVEEPESPGAEEFIAQSSIDTRLSEITGIYGLGYKLNDHWAVGLSNLFTVRSQNFNRTTLSRVLMNNPENTLISATFLRSTSYFHVRYAPKIGLAYKKGNWGWGLTLTAPSIGLFGNGSVAADVLGTNVMLRGKRTRILANDQQEKLKTRFRSPFSLSTGVVWHQRRSMIGFSADYYFGQEIYDVLRAEPADFLRPAEAFPELGSDDFLRVKSGNKPVFNWAIGYEYQWKPTVSLTASVRANNSFYDRKLSSTIGIKPEFTSWDIYHFTLGTTLKKGRMTSAGSTGEHPVDNTVTQPDEDNLLLGSLTITKANYFNIGALLGYTYTFKKLE